MGKATSKRAFVKTWGPKGYRENFVVYEKQCGLTEEQIVEACIYPYADFNSTALEIGCGGGFWLENYLVPLFKNAIGIDLLPNPYLDGIDCTYIEAPDQDYSCYGVADQSIDFVWSFGVFCHLPIDAIQAYLESAVRVLKPGGEAVLFFSNTEQRGTNKNPGYSYSGDQGRVGWTKNDWKKTEQLMTKAGFTKVTDLLPGHGNTLAYGKKP